MAPGNRNAAQGHGREMTSSVFPSGLAGRRRAKPEGKTESGRGGVLPRAAASAALPGADILLPFQDAGTANQRAPLGATMSTSLHVGRHWRRASEPERSAKAP
jgi:hypothetical protein